MPDFQIPTGIPNTQNVTFSWNQLEKLIGLLRPAQPSLSQTLPKLVIWEFKETDILTQRGRFKKWDDMFKWELVAADCLPFIKEPFGQSLTFLSESERRREDANVQKLFCTSVSPHIWTYAKKSTNMFEIYQKVTKLYQNTPTMDMIQINRNWTKLIFKVGFNQLFFVARYKQLLDDYAENDCVFSEEYKRTNFLSKILNLDDKDGPLYTFYREATGLKPKNRTLELTIQMFLETDLSKQGKKNKIYIWYDNKVSLSASEVVQNVNNLIPNYSFNSLICCSTETAFKRKRESKDTKPDAKKFCFDKPKSTPSTSTAANNSKSSNSKSALNSSVGSAPDSKSSSTSVPRASDKYSITQMQQIAKWTQEEKKKNRCGKCSEYFHTKDSCPNPGPLCFNCNKYGHFSQNYRQPKSEYNFKIDDFSYKIVFMTNLAASHHVVSNHSLLINYVQHSEPLPVSNHEPRQKTRLGWWRHFNFITRI